MVMRKMTSLVKVPDILFSEMLKSLGSVIFLC